MFLPLFTLPLILHVEISCARTGEIFGLLGHNGAGKTTLMGIMTGLHEPTSGSAEINGFDCVKDMTAIRQGLGVCPQHDILYDDLTVFEHVRLFASIKGVADSQIQAQAEKWLVKVGLMEKLNAMANTLSGGQKRRLSVALAMVGDPSVVILDEPTTGLDPAARREVWQCLKEARQDRLIILSTHFMDEADMLSDRKAIIAHGKLRCVGSSLFLKSHFGLGYSLELTKDGDGSTSTEPIQQLIMRHVPNATLVQETPATLHFTLPTDAVPKFSGLLSELETQLPALRCKSYGISAGSLASVFMRFADGGDLAVAATSAVSGRPAEMEAIHVDIDGPAQSGEDLSEMGQLKAMIHTKWLITRRNVRAFAFGMMLVSTQAIILGSIKRRNGLDRSSAGIRFERLLVVAAPCPDLRLVSGWSARNCEAYAGPDAYLHACLTGRINQDHSTDRALRKCSGQLHRRSGVASTQHGALCGLLRWVIDGLRSCERAARQDSCGLPGQQREARVVARCRAV